MTTKTDTPVGKGSHVFFADDPEEKEVDPPFVPFEFYSKKELNNILADTKTNPNAITAEVVENLRRISILPDDNPNDNEHGDLTDHWWESKSLALGILGEVFKNRRDLTTPGLVHSVLSVAEGKTTLDRAVINSAHNALRTSDTVQRFNLNLSKLEL